MRVSTLIVFFALSVAIALSFFAWRYSQQSPTVVEIESDALERVDWDELNSHIAGFIREAKDGHVAGALATEHQDVLGLALKVEGREYETHYAFPPLAAPFASTNGILCWPQLDVYVRRDSGAIQRIYLQEFCFQDNFTSWKRLSGLEVIRRKGSAWKRRRTHDALSPHSRLGTDDDTAIHELTLTAICCRPCRGWTSRAMSFSRRPRAQDP